VNKFIGHIIEDTLDSNPSLEKVKFTAAPRTDIINKTLVYEDGVYDFNVTGITVSPTPGAVYTANGLYFEVIHTVITGGSDTITCTRKGTGDPSASGTLTKHTGTGDSSITYSGFNAGIHNPFGYNFTSLYLYQSLIEDIFQLVNPSLMAADDSLEIVHDWKFWSGRFISPGFDGCYLQDNDLSELTSSPRALYLDNQAAINNCGDVLRKLAQDFCSFTGLISYDKAFFKKLFHYDSSNLQTVTVLSRSKGYRYNIIDYVKVNCNWTNVFGDEFFDPFEPYTKGTPTNLEHKSLTRDSLVVFFSYTTAELGGSSNYKETNCYNPGHSRINGYVFDHGSTISNYPSLGAVYQDGSGNTFEIAGGPLPGYTTAKITAVRLTGGTPPSSGTLTKISGTGDASYTYSSQGTANGAHYFYKVMDPSIDSGAWKNYGDLLAEFWHNYRGNIQNCRVDKFIFNGVDYDFLKDFNYDGSKYQPIAMRWLWSEGITECDAIYIGEV